jgi:hypothetical protein
MADVITLSEYKTAKNITTNSNDTQLSSLIPLISDYIQKYCNREFGIGLYTERREGVNTYDGRYMFFASNKPIISVSQINLYFYGITTPVSLNVSLLDIFNKAGYAYYSGALTFNQSVIRDEYREGYYYDIIYSGGQPAPGAVKLAAINMLTDTFERFYEDPISSGIDNRTGDLKSLKIGDYQETYAEDKDVLHNANTGLIMTKTVEDLLKPYKSTGVL